MAARIDIRACNKRRRTDLVSVIARSCAPPITPKALGHVADKARRTLEIGLKPLNQKFGTASSLGRQKRELHEIVIISDNNSQRVTQPRPCQ